MSGRVFGRIDSLFVGRLARMRVREKKRATVPRPIPIAHATNAITKHTVTGCVKSLRAQLKDSSAALKDSKQTIASLQRCKAVAGLRGIQGGVQ